MTDNGNILWTPEQGSFAFFERIKRHLTRKHGSCHLVCFLMAGPRECVDGVLLVVNRETLFSCIYFDPLAWKPVAGKISSTHVLMPEIPFLPIDPCTDQIRLVKFCVENMEPVEGSGFLWPEIIREQSAVWM